MKVKEYEPPVLNYTFIQARTFLRLPSGHRPTDLRMGVFRGDAGQWPDLTDNLEWENLPVADHPAQIILPVFAPPRLLSSLEPSPTFDVVGFCVRHLNGPVPDERRPDGLRQANFIQFGPDAICKFVAKIAHGSAVAMLGLDQFEPLLCDVVRNRDPYISTLVGSDKEQHWPLRSALHHVQLNLQNGYLVAQVQLFGRYGVTPFVAVVGTPTFSLLETLKSR